MNILTLGEGERTGRTGQATAAFAPPRPTGIRSMVVPTGGLFVNLPGDGSPGREQEGNALAGNILFFARTEAAFYAPVAIVKAEWSQRLKSILGCGG